MAYFGRILGLLVAAVCLTSFARPIFCTWPRAYFSVVPGSVPAVVDVSRDRPLEVVPWAALRWDKGIGGGPWDCWERLDVALEFEGEPSADERRLIAERAILWAKTNRLPHADRLADQLRTQTTITERRFSFGALAGWALLAGLIVGFFYGLGSMLDWCIAWARSAARVVFARVAR